jgi:PRTRC genetic system protein A
MYPNLVTYHIHRQEPLPPSDALAYQYILAGNGLFVRAEMRFFAARLPIAACVVRGLPLLAADFRLKIPRLSGSLLNSILADAGRVRRPDGGLNEVFYRLHYRDGRAQVRRPRQAATASSVVTAGDGDPSILCELHSHGNMAAYFSATDNADEQGARLYGVMGRLDSEPELQLRVGVYGYWLPLPVTAVFRSSGPFSEKEKQ